MKAASLSFESRAPLSSFAHTKHTTVWGINEDKTEAETTQKTPKQKVVRKRMISLSLSLSVVRG